MQQSHRTRINMDLGSGSAPRDADNVGEELHDANVTLLGSRLNRPVARALGETPPKATKDSAGVVAISPDRRGSLLPPKYNHLLAALSPADYARLLPHLESVHLPCGRVVCEANSNADYVYFLTTGIVSMMCELETGTSLEVGHTGNDGMVGIAISEYAGPRSD